MTQHGESNLYYKQLLNKNLCTTGFNFVQTDSVHYKKIKDAGYKVQIIFEKLRPDTTTWKWWLQVLEGGVYSDPLVEYCVTIPVYTTVFMDHSSLHTHLALLVQQGWYAISIELANLEEGYTL